MLLTALSTKEELVLLNIIAAGSASKGQTRAAMSTPSTENPLGVKVSVNWWYAHQALQLHPCRRRRIRALFPCDKLKRLLTGLLITASSSLSVIILKKRMLSIAIQTLREPIRRKTKTKEEETGSIKSMKKCQQSCQQKT